MYELLYVDQLRNMLHKFATYIVNQFGVGRVATAGTRWILYQAPGRNGPMQAKAVRDSHEM